VASEAKPKPTQSEVDVLLAAARATRKRPSRTMWIAALVVSVLCVAGLAYAMITDRNAEPERAAMKDVKRTSGSGFTLGLVIGIGAGIAIGSLIAVRRRQP
jgi:hypothetical protein